MMVEILVATAIIAVSILAAMAVAEKAVYASRLSFHITEASFLLEEGAEAVRIARDNAWGNISSLTSGADYYPTFSGGTWTLSGTPNTIGIFSRTISIANVNRDNATKDISSTGTDDPATKLVTVTVSWTEGGVTTSKILQFYITNLFS